MRKLTTPLTEEEVKSLHAGDHVLLSGVVYTARDAAHLRMMDLIRAGKPLPVDLAGQVIYYAGPTRLRACGDFLRLCARKQQEDEQQRQEGEKESFQLHALPLLLMRQERLHILDDRRNQVDDAVGDA